MKEFNLEQAKLGHPVCTRDGRPVRILCFDRKHEEMAYPIVALVTLPGNETEYTEMYDTYGKAYDTPRECDLMMASVKHEGWANVCVGDFGYFLSREIWATKDEALNHSEGGTKVATVKIEWEE